MVPSVVSINIGKYNIFHTPDEAMEKVCLHLKNILLFRTLKYFIPLIIEYKQNEKSPSAYLFDMVVELFLLIVTFIF